MEIFDVLPGATQDYLLFLCHEVHNHAKMEQLVSSMFELRHQGVCHGPWSYVLVNRALIWNMSQSWHEMGQPKEDPDEF